MAPSPIESLHCHTRTSDGELSYLGVLDQARKFGIKTVAFTDHDSLPTLPDRKRLFALKGHPTEFISGIELSVSHLEGLKPTVPLFHIVGLFVDLDNYELSDYCRTRQQARVERAKKMIVNLRKLGFALTWNDVLRKSGGLAVGRPHIAEALLAAEPNRKLLKKLEGAVKVKGRLIGTPRQRLFELLLTERALIKGAYVPYEDTLYLGEAVGLIHRAHGVAILAHWTFSKPTLSVSLLKTITKKRAVDGLEVVYGLDVKDRLGELTRDFKILRQLAVKERLLMSGGADAHTAGDFKNFAQSPLAQGTIGMAAEIVKRVKPNMRWSSIK